MSGESLHSASFDAPATACLDEDALLSMVDGRMAPALRRVADRHVDGCEECRTLLAALARASIPDSDAASPPAPEAAVLPGDLAARFNLLRKVGEGPHGVVYAALDRSKNEHVAVKWIHDPLARRDGAAERVRSVVHATRTLDLPNVLRVREALSHRGALVIVSELAEGSDLANLLSSRELAPNLVRDVIAQLVTVIAAAHRHGVVHADLKPQNVIVDLAGHVLVTDFGLAGALRGALPSATPDVKRADVCATAAVALDLLDRVSMSDGDLRELMESALSDEATYASAVDLEAALHRAVDKGRLAALMDVRPHWIPAPGDVIGGRYRVEGLLGTGGMGVVLTAIQVDLGRRVAIKLMPPRAARRKSAVERFLREARAASSIQSPHVVHILDVGRTESGTPYIVMEYLVGATLGRLVSKRGPLPVREAITYVLQACVAVAECHARGIVHRDLKPENIMVLEKPGQRGFVKVLDFGISKTEWFDDPVKQSSLTGSLDVLGTPTYMSPEQVRSSKLVDARTDIWALGVILYEVLTGRPPFVGENIPSLSARIVSDQPLAPSALRPDVPAELEQVILACLNKNPDDRPESVHQLAEALGLFAPPAAAAFVEGVRGVGRASVPPRSSPSAAPPPGSSPRASSFPPARVSEFPPARISAPPPARISGLPSAPRSSAPPRGPSSAPPPVLADSATPRWEAWDRYIERRAASRRFAITIGAGLLVLVSFGLVWVLSQQTTPDAAPATSVATPPVDTVAPLPIAEAPAPAPRPAATASASAKPKTKGPYRPPKSGPLDERY